jgi:hypothetical protein
MKRTSCVLKSVPIRCVFAERRRRESTRRWNLYTREPSSHMLGVVKPFDYSHCLLPITQEKFDFKISASMSFTAQSPRKSCTSAGKDSRQTDRHGLHLVLFRNFRILVGVEVKRRRKGIRWWYLYSSSSSLMAPVNLSFEAATYRSTHRNLTSSFSKRSPTCMHNVEISYSMYDLPERPHRAHMLDPSLNLEI